MEVCNFYSSPYVTAHYVVDLGYVHGTVAVTGKVITDASPSLAKFIGARIMKFKLWVERKGGICTKVRGGEW